MIISSTESKVQGVCGMEWDEMKTSTGTVTHLPYISTILLSNIIVSNDYNHYRGPKQIISKEVEYLAMWNSIFSQQRCSIQVEIIKYSA